LHEILKQCAFTRVDAHIHTHLCDGHETMTVKNIAEKAKEAGMELIILTPHFHKQVSDETATLYHDTDENILVQLREEIDAFEKKDKSLKILLSTEADILDMHGTTALSLSPKGEEALDLVTPTVNYHPLLPLKAVEVTMGRTIEDIHNSGLYAEYAQRIGGIPCVLETLYQAEANAILRCKYPVMLGHFFAAHSYAVGNLSWFGASLEQIEIMREGAKKIIDACVKTGAMIDVTGVHCRALGYQEKKEYDGFFFEFQKWFLEECKKHDILAFPGCDSHGLNSVGEVGYYRQFFS